MLDYLTLSAGMLLLKRSAFVKWNTYISTYICTWYVVIFVFECMYVYCAGIEFLTCSENKLVFIWKYFLFRMQHNDTYANTYIHICNGTWAGIFFVIQLVSFICTYIYLATVPSWNFNQNYLCLVGETKLYYMFHVIHGCC